jgi:hypothetical protein
MNILEAIDDPNLFRPWFRDPRTWDAWRAFLMALFALPADPRLLPIYGRCTGRTTLPTERAAEAWLICGRRAGKSFTLALIAVFLACFYDYRPFLQPGERATVLVVAADRKQARVIFRYIGAMLTRIPMLKRLIMDRGEKAEAYDLTNGVSIEVGTASVRAVRGYTIVAALCDEIAFWPVDDDAAHPDYEILDAIRPAMATIPGAMLLCASSPYAKRGALYDAFQRYYGKPGPVLVWKAPTREMNPSVPQRIIDDAIERDAAAAASEWLAEFRNDIAAFVPREIVKRCVSTDIAERPYRPGLRYTAFVDASGGTSDSMTLAIGHREGDLIITDVVREIRAPFDPESATDEYALLLKRYGIHSVTGDRYAGDWPRQAFRKRGIDYALSEMPKSALYVDLLPKLNSQTIRLVDNPRLLGQLASLERRTSRGGRDSIDHAPGGHDDVANVVAGLAAHLVRRNTVKVEPLWI